MKQIKIPADAPTTETLHGTPVAVGRFVDQNNETLSEWKHPPGKTVPVPDEVDQIEVNQK